MIGAWIATLTGKHHFVDGRPICGATAKPHPDQPGRITKNGHVKVSDHCKQCTKLQWSRWSGQAVSTEGK